MKSARSKVILTPLLLLLLATACTDENPEQQIKSARDYLQKNETRAATIQIKNVLQKNPDSAEARYLLGTILLQEGNISAAEIELRKALAAKHPDSVVVPELARAMLMGGQAKKLVEEFGSAKLEQPAADASLQTTLAGAYGMLGKPDLARVALASALARDPGYVPARLAEARQKAAAKDFDTAILITDKVISEDPKNADAWKLKGDIALYAQNKVDDALAAYKKSIEVNPRFSVGYLAVLTTLMQQGNLDEAGKQLEKLRAFAPSSLQTIFVGAQLAYLKKDFKQAKELCQQLLRVVPDNPRILELAGAVELQMNSPIQAEIYLARATQTAPDLALARRLLIVTYLRSGQSAKALAALNAAAGSDGLAPELYSVAGEVYLQNGDAKKAEEYFAKAVELEPGNAGKRTALAISHMLSGQTAVAFGELQEIASSDSGITADLALISAHWKRKEFDKALAAIDRLEQKLPGKPLAANLRGRIQLAQNDRAAARKSFERALTIDPSYFAAAASLAALDVADKKPNEAKERFELLLKRNPKNGMALLALAELAATQGASKDEVAGLVNKAIQSNPNDVAPRLLLINLFLKANDNKQAESTAQSAVSALPSSPELLDALGRAQQASGDLNQAIATFRKAIAMQPLSPQRHIRLAEAHMANKDTGAAEQSLRKALEIKPDQLDAQRALILLEVDAKNYTDAIRIARVVQQQRPKSSAGYLFEGDIANVQKNWSAAAAAYRTALERDAPPDTSTKLHAVLIASGKVAEADVFASNWKKEHPKDVVFLTYQGELAIAKGEFAAAEKQYQMALQAQPDNAVVLNNLAWVAGQLRKNGAVELAEKANKLAPNQPTFMDTLAMLLADKNEFARAIELQTKAVSLQPSNPGLRLGLAKIYIKAGDKRRAKTELETLAKLGNKFSSQTEVNTLLQTL